MTRKPSLAIQHPLNIYVQGDLSQLDQLKQMSCSNAGIVHYACASLGGKMPQQVDIDAMEILLNNWEEGAFTFISSLDVYGGASDSISLVNEQHALSGRFGSYAEGKIACEGLLFDAAKQRGREDFTILRAPWIFAPSLASREHIQRRFLKAFEKEIILPGTTQIEWEKYMDVWVDARDLAWLAAESVVKPLGGAGNVVGEHFNWTDFFSIVKTVANLDLPIVHKSIEEVDAYIAELCGQTAKFSGQKVNDYYGFKPKYHQFETLQHAFLSSNKI
jgi:nucleoside-diphosphate-sugar epimerase